MAKKIVVFGDIVDMMHTAHKNAIVFDREQTKLAQNATRVEQAARELATQAAKDAAAHQLEYVAGTASADLEPAYRAWEAGETLRKAEVVLYYARVSTRMAAASLSSFEGFVDLNY